VPDLRLAACQDVRMTTDTQSPEQDQAQHGRSLRPGPGQLTAGWSAGQNQEVADLLGRLARALLGDRADRHPATAGLASAGAAASS
jgi:hypothetical protein